VLLFGAPGTGKTLIAKAIATESEANFISIKGPEVMSKWVGESEKAIRMIFKKAKQVSPAIIFLDEIDAIAPRRGAYSDSGVSERMVNQLLTSMDGLEGLDSVVIIGATNRPDIIDPALLRPGRFDRILLVTAPDEQARLKILQVHTKSMPIAGVDLESLAKRLDGFVGADIENLCREAAMVALRQNRKASEVTQEHFEEALSTIKPSTDDTTAKYYENMAKELSTATAKRKKEDFLLGYYR
jgi:transitional endoplasmic reticulum ATPase